MAPRMERVGLGCIVAVVCLAECLPRLLCRGGSGWTAAAPHSFVAGRLPQLLQRPRQQGLRVRPPKEPEKREAAYKVNEQIRYAEVRVIAEVGLDGNNTNIEDTNEIMLTSEAIARAAARGLDLVLVNEDRDPPLAKIVKVSNYAYLEQKKLKQKERQGKAPKMKEVRVSYTIGDHDLETRLRQCEKWLQNARQQVKMVVQMRGRSRMFEKQAKQLMQRIQVETASFAKAAASAKTGEAITKDGQGNFVMMLSSGADVKLLKLLKEQGLEDMEEEEEEEADEDDPTARTSSKKGQPAASPELQELLEELDEVKQDLLDCGISPGQLSQQPEFVEVTQRIEELKAKTGASALATHSPSAASGVLRAAGFALAAASLAVAVRRPRSAEVRSRRPR